MASVSDGPLTAYPVALLQVEGMFPVGVLPRLQLLAAQVGLLIEAGHQLVLELPVRRMSDLQGANAEALRVRAPKKQVP